MSRIAQSGLRPRFLHPENAVRLISRQNSKRAPIANRYGLRFVTDLAHEFVDRLCGASRKRLIAARAVRKICAQSEEVVSQKPRELFGPFP